MQTSARSSILDQKPKKTILRLKNKEIDWVLNAIVKKKKKVCL